MEKKIEFFFHKINKHSTTAKKIYGRKNVIRKQINNSFRRYVYLKKKAQ